METKTRTKQMINRHRNFYIKFLAVVLIMFIELSATNAQYTKIFDFQLGNTDIQNPGFSRFVTDGTSLYAMTITGGNEYLDGALFKINPDGSGYQTLLKCNDDIGKWPGGKVMISGATLYCMTTKGGAFNEGVIFKINTDGTGFQKLLDFDGPNKGSRPIGTLILIESTLYGVTEYGGVNDYGVIFKINPDGTGYQKLHDFDDSNGRRPRGELIKIGNELYGTTRYGGSNGNGVIFKIGTNGSGFAKIFEFTGTNGKYPTCDLTLSGSVFYGLTHEGGTYDEGVLYKINTDGTGYQKLLDFGGTISGKLPYGKLIISGTVMYGVTYRGGTSNEGTIFRINTDGTGYQTLFNFDRDNNGCVPYESFLLIGSTLYGMTPYGGYNDDGIIYKIDTDGTNFHIIKHCALPGSEAQHENELVTDNSVIYGTTRLGGTNAKGTIYKINPDGTGFLYIYNFESDINGYTPTAPVLSGSTIYGMTNKGGANDFGIIYKINTDGSGFQKLLDFDGTGKGANPLHNSLTILGSTLYGVTEKGGTNNYGVLFKMNTDGSGFQKLLNFNSTNSGRYPISAPILSGTQLYVVSNSGGANGHGVLFKINTDGTGFQKLYDFNATSGPLTLLESSFYGMARDGGSHNMGFVFKVNTDGTGFQNLSDFDGTNNGSYPNHTALTFVGSSFYGTTGSGGTNNAGVMFKIDPDGNNFQKLVDFSASDGSNPITSLLYLNSALYGATLDGGTDDIGVIYKESIDIDELQIEATGGNLTCSVPVIHVDVTSNIAGVTYEWSGPGGFTSTIKNPEVSITGDYFVKVTYGSESKTDMTTVTQDINVPGAMASGGNITCTSTSVILTGNSPTPGVSFKWTGPEGYTSTQRTPVTTIPGEYILSVLNPVNGCISSDIVIVQHDSTVPEDVTATVEGILTSTQTNVKLSGSSSTSGVTYNWSGPNNFGSAEQNPLVSAPGSYSLKVTCSGSGCSSFASALVEQDTTCPTEVIATASGILTCTNTTVTLTGSSSSSGVAYGWLDPNSVNLTGNPVEVSIPGTYILTVTGIASGCSESTNVTVEQDIETPAGLTASVSDTLSCEVTSVILSASSTTAVVTYHWEGPQGLISNEQYTVTSIPGNYSVTATDPNNGCTLAEQVIVAGEECQGL